MAEVSTEQLHAGLSHAILNAMINKIVEDTRLAYDIQEAEYFRCIVDGAQIIGSDEQLVILF